MVFNKGEILICEAKSEDAESLRSLRIQLVKENPKTYGVVHETERKKKTKHFTDWIQEHLKEDARIFLLEVGGKVIGMGAVKRAENENPEIGYLGSLGILNEYQGRGFGRLLVQHHLDWAKKNTRFKKVKTIVQKRNTRMLKLAKSFGFAVVGEGKYRGVPEFYLEKNL